MPASTWMRSRFVRRAGGLVLCAVALVTLISRAEPPSRMNGAAPVMSPAAQRYLDEALNLMATRSIDRRRVDWVALREQLMRQVGGARTTAATYPAIYTALAALGNPHSTLIPPQPGGPFPGAGTLGRVPRGEALAPDLAQLVLPSITGPEQIVLEYVRAGGDSVERLDAAAPCGWIVDLRENHGGNMWPMLVVVAPAAMRWKSSRRTASTAARMASTT